MNSASLPLDAHKADGRRVRLSNILATTTKDDYLRRPRVGRERRISLALPANEATPS